MSRFPETDRTARFPERCADQPLHSSGLVLFFFGNNRKRLRYWVSGNSKGLDALTTHPPLSAALDGGGDPGNYKARTLTANLSPMGRETRADADTAGVLTMDEARRIAANIAKLPTFLAANLEIS